MLTLEDALARCMSLTLPRRTETLPLAAAHGRVLAEDLSAPAPLPPWDSSAMDGFALRHADCATTATTDGQSDCDLGAPAALPPVVARLPVALTIPAGSTVPHVLAPGTAARIMTGAPLPTGADTVVMQENTSADPDAPDHVRIHGLPRLGQHIRRRGEEVSVGAPLLSAGDPLTPARVGLLSAVGLTHVSVIAPPRVALLSTGDELVPPGQPLAHGQIWSSNAATLAGLVLEAGGIPLDLGQVPDTRAATVAALQGALETGCDLILSTGGVSVGDFDVVKEALADVGAEMAFWKVRLKPGKPLALGQVGGVPIFGLPGNPVSAALGFLQFVRPLLRKTLGDPRPYLPALRATLRAPGGYRRRPGRAELVRVALSLEGGRLVAALTGAQSSAWLSSVARADALLLVGADSSGAEDGAEVWVQPLQGGGFLSSATPDYPW